MTNWTIGKKLLLSVSALAILTLTVGGVSFYGVKSLGATIESLVKVEAKFLDTADMLDTAGSDLIAGERGILLATVRREKSRQDAAIKAFGQASDEMKALIATAVPLVASKPAQKADLDKLQQLFATLPAAQDDFMAHIARDDVDAASATFNEKVQPILNEMNGLAGALADRATVEMEASGTAAESVVTRTLVLVLIVAVLAGIAAATAVFVVRSTVKTLTGMVNNLRSGSEQVTSAATQVAASSQSLSQGSTEQAASLEETSASMEEMASMTRKNAENSQQAAQQMAEVDRVVDGANRALGEMTQSMASIRESSNKVAKIIKTIDEIAFQTNILALNAAVEAARAGEAGMGFAVVADEVRNLAQRSAQAAKDTAALIEESITNSHEGNAKVETVAKSIAGITENVGKVKGLVTEVSEASRQQSQGIDQVAQAVAQMEKVTQSTAASAEESAAASEELNAQAEATMAEVARLEAMVVGTGSAPRPQAPARAASARPATRAQNLLKLPVAGKPKASAQTAEDEIPMGDTGTWGRF